VADGKTPEKGLLTIDDVAQAAGVSRSTVSLVLRNSTLVATPTSEKVRETIARLGYVYNRKAAIRARLSHLIGIIIPDLSNPFFSELTAGIDAVLNEAGWVSVLGSSREAVERQSLIIQRMQEHQVDALIVCPAVGSPSFAGVAQPSLPLLQVLRHTDTASDHYLGIDYAQGMALAVEHLAALGHSSIVFLGEGPHHSAAIERRAGFEDALRRRGLEPRYKPCGLTRSDAADAAAALMADAEPPTALICFNDVVAMGAMAGLDAIGKRVGADISVVGFDNVAEASFVRPPLTTIDSNARELGAQAARLVLAAVDKRSEPAAGSVMPTRLVVRRSTGPAPGRA
jgi:LacI family transcriptional regulator